MGTDRDALNLNRWARSSCGVSQEQALRSPIKSISPGACSLRSAFGERAAAAERFGLCKIPCFQLLTQRSVARVLAGAFRPEHLD